LGTTCAATTCTGTVETPARTCDGLGLCRPAGASRSCAPYVCGATACASTCASSAQCAPATSCVGTTCSASPGLALFWRFEEASGTTAVDASGNGRNGIYIGESGTPTPSSVLPPQVTYGNAASRAFTLASRHAVWLETMPAPMMPANDLTIAAWYRATEVDLTGGGSPFAIGSEVISGSNAYTLRLRANANGSAVKQIEFAKRISNNGFVSVFGNAPTFLDGNWHHIAGTASKTGGIRVYYDGVEVGATPSELTDIVYTTSARSFLVGRHGDGQTQWDFGGNIDEVRMYTRVLSPAEIAVLAGGKNN
jgi:hypothetical protein